ncbi:MAG: NAD-dependent epimerase/dehydratase family protein, partial [Pseudomonadota bacterium]
MSQTKTVLVTGGAGFIGSHMVDVLLERGMTVRVVDNLAGGHERNLNHHRSNPALSCEWADIRDLAPDASIFRDVNYIIHFAGIGDIVPSIEQPIEYMSVNVQGTVRVLEGARAAGAEKFVYAA